MVCVDFTTCMEIFWAHLMELLGDVDSFGDSLHQMCHRLKNHFGHTLWYSYVMWVKWKLISVHLETMLISTQDRRKVCAERAIGLEIILGAPNGTPR
jgi:hypothetical protein